MPRRNTGEHSVELAQLQPVLLSQEKKNSAKEILEDVLERFSSSLLKLLDSQEYDEQAQTLGSIVHSFDNFSPTKQHLSFTYRQSPSGVNYPTFTVSESSLINANDASTIAQKIYDLTRQIASNLHKYLGDIVYTFIKNEEYTHVKDQLVSAGLFERDIPEKRTPRQPSNHASPGSNLPDAEAEGSEERPDTPMPSEFVPLRAALSPDFPQLFKPIPLFGNTVSLWFSLGLFELFNKPKEGEPPTLRTSKFARVKYGLLQIQGLLLVQRLDNQTASDTSLVQLMCHVSNLINTHRKRTYDDSSRPETTLSGKRFATLLLKRDNAYFRRIILEDAYAISHKSNPQTHPLSKRAETLLIGIFEFEVLGMHSEFLLNAHRNGTATPSSDHVKRLGILLRAWGKCRHVLQHNQNDTTEGIQKTMNELFDPGSTHTHAPLTTTITGRLLEEYARDNASRYKSEMKLSRLRGEML